MNSRQRLLLVSMIVLVSSCEESDTTPPQVSIVSPQSGTIVYEIATISCVATDNDAINKVELWIEGVGSGSIDTEEPYILKWNTITYDNKEYSISVRATDATGNTADSEVMLIAVDNSSAIPQVSTIAPIIYSNESFILSWSICNDTDFGSYELRSSNSMDMMIYNVELSSLNAQDTTTEIIGVEEGDKRYFQIVTSDTLGLQAYSTIVEGNAIVLFNNVYESVPNLYPIKIISTSDGGYCLIGNDTSPRFLKIDKYGGLEWTRGVSNVGNVVRDACVTIDDGFVFVGDIPSSYNNSYDLLLQKISADGIEVWRRIYHTPEQDMGFSLTSTSDGGFIVVGTTMSYGGGDAWVIRVDAEGDSLWTNHFGTEGWDYASKIESTQNNDYIISGMFGSDLFLTKINSNGNQMWEMIYPDLYLANLMDLRIASNDDIFFCGGATGYSEHIDMSIGKTDSDGNLEWEEIFNYGFEDAAASIHPTDDGGSIVFGTTHGQSTENTTAVILELNSSGAEERVTLGIGGNIYTICTSGLITSDNGLIFSGLRHNLEECQPKPWIAKASPSGEMLAFNHNH